MTAPNIPAQTTPTNISDLDEALAGKGGKVFLLKMEPTDLAGGTSPLYLSTGDYRDVDARPRLVMPSSVDISILNRSWATGDRPEDGRLDLERFKSTDLTIGGFSARNEDGELDAWRTAYGWGDAACTLLFGDETVAVGSLVAFMTFKVKQQPRATFDANGRAELAWEVKSPVLNPYGLVRPTYFAGSGGLEGGADLEGESKPLLIGRYRNIEPAFLKDGTLGYLIDPDKVDSISAVYQGGRSVGASPTYYTDNGTTDGTFDLSAIPNFGPITCDAVGWTGAGRTGSTNDESLAANVGILAGLGGTTITTAGLTEDGGVWLPPGADAKFEDVLGPAIRPLGLGPWPAQDGSELLAGELGSPEDGTSVKTYTANHIVGCDIDPAGPPAWKVSVGWQPLGKVLSGIEAGGAVTEAEIARLTAPIRWSAPAGAEDATIKTDYPNALHLLAWSSLYNEADAATLAAEIFNVFSVERHIYRVRVNRHALAAWIGEVVTLDLSGVTGKPTYGLDTPKKVMVTGWSVQFGATDLHGGSFVMECWG